MADPRFFNKSGPITLGQLAEISRAEIGGTGNPDQLFSDVAPLSSAGPTDVSFLDNKKYLDDFAVSGAGVCIVDPQYSARAPRTMALLLTVNPYQGYARVAEAFYPAASIAAVPAGDATFAGYVDKSAQLGAGCTLGPGAVVGAGVVIGNGTRIGPGVVIGPGVRVGRDCRLEAGATVQFALIGDNCILHPGVRIGQDGFGFAPGGPPEGHVKVPQLGRVMIGDDVEIGANTTIDRGSGPDTVIGRGTKIDNLVQIAHNVTLGEGCFVAAQVGISGSTRIGNYVMIGGQAGFAGHLSVGDGARISGRAGVFRDVEPGARMVGVPAIPEREFWRQVATLKKLSAPKKRKAEH